jgi:hypothetical protein
MSGQAPPCQPARKVSKESKMQTAILISGMTLSALASGALTLAYCRAKSSDMVEAYIERGEQLSAVNSDYIKQLLRASQLQDKLNAIHRATVGSKNGTAIMVARMSGTTPERAAIRAKAKDMAIANGRDDLASKLA